MDDAQHQEELIEELLQLRLKDLGGRAIAGTDNSVEVVLYEEQYSFWIQTQDTMIGGRSEELTGCLMNRTSGHGRWLDESSEARMIFLENFEIFEEAFAKKLQARIARSQKVLDDFSQGALPS